MQIKSALKEDKRKKEKMKIKESPSGFKLDKKNVRDIIKTAFHEDFNKLGDITTDAIFSGKEIDEFIIIAKDNGIVAGLPVAAEVFHLLDKKCTIQMHKKDGDMIKNKDIVLHLKGKVSVILKGERAALNFLSHLSGIATKTDTMVKAADGKMKILDTRKTLPGLRSLEKYAVSCSGGINHRMGLYDMVLIKDNHIDAAGSITNAVEKVKKKWGKRFKIEVETRTLDDVKEALSCGVDRIMLDNMDNDLIKKAIEIIMNKAEVEISGNIDFERLLSLKMLNITNSSDSIFVSMGELTHSVKAFDFSLQYCHDTHKIL